MAGSLTSVKKQSTSPSNKPKVSVPGSSTVTIRQGTSSSNKPKVPVPGSSTVTIRQGTSSSNKPKVPVPGSSTVTIRQGTSPSLFSDEDFEAFADRFTSLGEVKKEIKKVVDVDIGLIFGIDYTMSNNKQGQNTFGGKSLHHISEEAVNPYQEVICILGETVGNLDDDGIIPAFGFGDNKVKDKGIFPLKKEGELEGFCEVLEAYNEMTPNIRLGGPTNFAPIIEEAVRIVKEKQQFHILVIVADGQVTSEEETIDAIVQASHFPLSIVVIGVGDGPWEVMEEFDDKLPARLFDNFQFVDFHKVKNGARSPEAAVALAALMEIPDQFKAIRNRELLSRLSV